MSSPSRAFHLGLLILSSVSRLACAVECPSSGHPPLRGLADKNGMYIGSAGFLHIHGDDPCYQTVLSEQYNLVTAAAFYWGEVEPERNVFNFVPADTDLAYAEAAEQTVRCHNLVWHISLPSWINSSLPSSELQDILWNHLRNILNHVKGRCYAYDVVNEPINEDGTLRKTIWYNALGGGVEYLAKIFRFVHELDPYAKLFLNEDSIEVDNPKSRGYFNILQQLVQMGVPIHGVGWESHFLDFMNLPSVDALSSNMAKYSSLGLELHITELDVSLKTRNDSIADAWVKQGQFYADYLNVCLEHSPPCRSYETWDYTDRYTWLGMTEQNPIVSNAGYMFAPLPFDARYYAKPAVGAMVKVLQSHADRK